MKMPPNGQVLAAPRCVKMNRIIVYSESEKMWKKMSVAKLTALQVPWHLPVKTGEKHKIYSYTGPGWDSNWVPT